MTLVKEGLWGIVKGTETFPEEVTDEAQARFQARMDITVYKAFSIIVLSSEPSLLFLIGDPENPVTVWTKLTEQFQKNNH